MLAHHGKLSLSFWQLCLELEQIILFSPRRMHSLHNHMQLWTGASVHQKVQGALDVPRLSSARDYLVPDVSVWQDIASAVVLTLRKTFRLQKCVMSTRW